MPSFPTVRLRRLRAGKALRNAVAETKVSPEDLIAPIFVREGLRGVEPIESMPGKVRYGLDTVVKHVEQLVDLNIRAILLFGIPKHKDPIASSAFDKHGVVQEAVRKIREVFSSDELIVATDVCLCSYTDHGHCGLLKQVGGRWVVDNDSTLEIIAKVALSHAEAGADIVAPSGMMDGMVKAIRSKLDENGYEDIAIMSYAAKYASTLYGPFREAAESAPRMGPKDRKSYQMDPRNAREALREVRLDIEEGADIVMVKPALFYLDIIRLVKEEFGYPTAAYNVSGEYVMVKLAAERGLVDEAACVWEMLHAIKRAGADMIITYYAEDYGRWLKEGRVS